MQSLVCRAMFLLVFSLPLAYAEQALKPITHEDLWLMPRVGEPVISPDGRRAVVAVTRPAYDPDEQISDLWLLDVARQEQPRQLTFDGRGGSHMTWSSDSRYIAFSAARGNGEETEGEGEGEEVNDKTAQIHVLDMEGGGDARPFSSLVTGARHPRFSPDGQRIAFVSNVPAGARELADIDRLVETDKARDYNVLTYTGFPIRNWNTWLTDRQPRLFVQGVDASEPVDLLAGSDLLASPGYDGRRSPGISELDAIWTPDGDGLVFVASRNRDRSAFGFTHEDLWLVPATGGEPRRLTGSDSPEGADNWSGPRFAPDGQTLYALRVSRTEWVYNAAHLVVMDWPAMTIRREIELPDARAVMEYFVTPDSGDIYLLAEDAGLVRLYRAPADGGAVEAAFAMDAGIYTNLSGASETPVLIANYQTSTRPPEVVRIDFENGGHAAISEFTAEALAGLDLSPPEHFWFESERGARIHNMLVRPAGFDPERQYPLLVLMHGGPHTMWRDYFFLRWNYHLLAGSDYVVLLTNYTGSTGFGEDFARGIQFDPLRGPAEEINQAADEAIARFDFIDGGRQCAGGASYGGHLANWMQSATDRYRCLISHAGLVNLETQWGTSDVIYHREVNVGGPPWAIPDVWARQNPIRYAENWRTPVLVTVGKRDERVPLPNVLEYWSALQRQQVESRLLVYPDMDHWIMRGPESRHFYGEVSDWLARWLLEND